MSAENGLGCKSCFPVMFGYACFQSDLQVGYFSPFGADVNGKCSEVRPDKKQCVFPVCNILIIFRVEKCFYFIESF